MKFLIVTPRYLPNSNGIKILHKICHTINHLGGDARLTFIETSQPGSQKIVFGSPTWANDSLNTPVLAEEDADFIQEAYVIYPETIVANPLNTKRVVRYFGNKESYCNGRSVLFGNDDFIVAHSKVIRPNADFILYNADINPVFHNVDSLPYDQRKLDVTYIGKGYIYGNVEVVPHTLYIGREWPISQDQLALVLRQTRFFFTWDAWTSINTEAVLCGAVPVILDYGPWKPEEIDDCETGSLPRAEMCEEGIKVDIEMFNMAREELINNIGELSRSWNGNVLEFMATVSNHFNKK